MTSAAVSLSLQHRDTQYTIWCTYTPPRTPDSHCSIRPMLEALMFINTHTPLPHKSMKHPCREHIPSPTTLSYLDPQGGNVQHYRLLQGQNLPCFIDPRSHKEMKGGLLQQLTHVLTRFDHNVERAGWGETQERKKCIWSNLITNCSSHGAVPITWVPWKKRWQMSQRMVLIFFLQTELISLLHHFASNFSLSI